MKVHWARASGGGRNFGDQLGPALLRHFGLMVEWSFAADAELVTVGSILSKVPDRWRGMVLGTGFIRDGMRKDLSRARVLAVRGLLTRRACRLPQTPLGDPGILVGDLYQAGALRDLGEVVVPHYVDDRIARRHPTATIVSITTDPRAIVSAIAAASVVYTSSLHALIAADALGIPQVLELHPAVTGGLFKFSDYASAFGQEIRPGVSHLTDRGAMAERQAEIRGLFAQVAQEMA
jgi:pyruvyltransferase